MEKVERKGVIEFNEVDKKTAKKNKKSKLCLILWYIPKTYFVHKFWNKKLLILLKKVEKITSYFLRITNLWNNYFTKTLENIIKYVCMMHHYDFRTILIKK